MGLRVCVFIGRLIGLVENCKAVEKTIDRCHIQSILYFYCFLSTFRYILKIIIIMEERIPNFEWPNMVFFNGLSNNFSTNFLFSIDRWRHTYETMYIIVILLYTNLRPVAGHNKAHTSSVVVIFSCFAGLRLPQK